MNARLCLWGVVAVGWLLAATATAQDTAKGPAQPSPEHQALARLAGEYTTVTKFVAKPGDTPTETQGTATLRSVVAGKFLLEEYSGKWFGQTIHGLRLLGYNDASKQYEGTWTYSLNTGMMTLVGASKDDGKTIDLTATFSGDKGEKQTLYVTTRRVGADQFVVELYAKTADGQRGATMETTYTRKK